MSVMHMRELIARELSARPLHASWHEADAAVLLVLVPVDGRVCLLLTRRAAGLRRHAGEVAFPGGKRDAGDAGSVAVALREAHEEIGLEPAQVQVLGGLRPLRSRHGLCVAPVVGWLEGPFSPVPCEAEIAEVFAVPLDWLAEPGRLEVESLPPDSGRSHPYAFRYRHHRIWGLTASAIVELLAAIPCGVALPAAHPRPEPA